MGRGGVAEGAGQGTGSSPVSTEGEKGGAGKSLSRQGGSEQRQTLSWRVERASDSVEESRPQTAGWERSPPHPQPRRLPLDAERLLAPQGAHSHRDGTVCVNAACEELWAQGICDDPRGRTVPLC